jgi:hypothetical protein
VSDTNIVSDIPLDENTARAREALIRTATNGLKHRLVCEFKLVEGQLGVAASLERRGYGRWQATRPATWIPLHAHSTPLLHLLMHIAEHGRLPNHPNPPGAPPSV